MHVLKVGVSDVGFKCFTPQGADPSFKFPPKCAFLLLGWGLWQDCVSASSTHFSVVFYSFSWCVVITQPDFTFFREEIIPYVAVDSLCP